MNIIQRLFSLSAFVALGFFSTVLAVQATTLFIKGDIVYRERMALPEGAQVEVTLFEVSANDEAPKEVVKTLLTPKNSSPIAYEIFFDSSALTLGRSYALSAKIKLADKVIFASPALQAIFNGKEKDTLLLVTRTSDKPEETKKITSIPTNKATDITEEKTIETDKAAPVEEKTNKNEEIAILTEGKNSLLGDWIFVAIQGQNTSKEKSAVMTISKDNRVNGSSGCNRFNGAFKVEDEKLTFSPMVSTKMACDQSLMEQEIKLFETFNTIKAYSILDGELLFFDAKQKPLLKLTRKK